MKKIIFFTIFFAGFFVFAGGVSAAPVINSAPSCMSDGQSVTISGNNFGNHVDYQPNEDYLVAGWENLDDGYANPSVWNTGGNNGPEFWSNAGDQRTGSINCAKSGGYSGTYTNIFCDTKTGKVQTIISSLSNSLTWYMSGWFMLGSSAMTVLNQCNSAQVKFISTRQTTTPVEHNQYWNFFSYNSGGCGASGRINYEEGRGANNPSELLIRGATGNDVINQDE